MILKLLISTLLLLATPRQGCLELDIILVADLSGSVYRNEYFVADAFDAFVDRFKLSETTIKVGVVVFNDHPMMLTGLTADKDKVRLAIDIIRRSSGNGTTNMVDAFYIAANELINGGRYGVKKVLIIVSDGKPNRRTAALETILQLRTIYDLSVCGVWIGGDFGEVFMQNISSDYCYVVSDYRTLVKRLKRLDVCT